MDDTAQPLAAETDLNAQLDGAAEAIRAMRNPQPRDEAGRFAAGETDEAEEAEEVETNDEPEEHDAEAPEEDQAEAVEMPKSWSKEDADLWQELPPEAQARIAEREGQRDAAINSKFQEVANVRKDFESKLTEANANRDKWAQEYDTLIADLSVPKPDPRQYGLGTGNYDRESYDLAMLQWEQATGQLDQLRKQREEIRAQQEREEAESFNQWKQQHEAEYAPKLLSIVPDLTDPVKAEPAIRGLIDYALSQGIPQDTFAEENQPYITSGQLLVLAKAKKFDELSSGTAKPAPKKQPVIKPGVATPRAAQKSIQRQKAFERLESENSVEAAVAAMRANRR